MNDNENGRAVGRRPMALGVRAFVKENGPKEETEEAAVDMQRIIRRRRYTSDRSRRCDDEFITVGSVPSK